MQFHIGWYCQLSCFIYLSVPFLKIPKVPTITRSVVVLRCHVLFYSFESFSNQHQLIIFHWCLNDWKSPQASRILLSILDDLNSLVVWMVSNCVLISNSSSSLTNPLVTLSSAQITNGITVTFMFHIFSSFLTRSRFLSLFSSSFNFTLGSAETAKSTIR